MMSISSSAVAVGALKSCGRLLRDRLTATRGAMAWLTARRTLGRARVCPLNALGLCGRPVNSSAQVPPTSARPVFSLWVAAFVEHGERVDDGQHSFPTRGEKAKSKTTCRYSGRDRGTAFALFLAAVALLTLSAEATLTFQRSTDVLGVASVFEEGICHLPTRNFTFSSTVRGSSGGDAMFVQRAGLKFSIMYWSTSGLVDVLFDSTSHIFDPSAIISTEDLIMTKRTWTVTYDDAAGKLALYIDTMHIDTKKHRADFSGIKNVWRSHHSVPACRTIFFYILR